MIYLGKISEETMGNPIYVTFEDPVLQSRGPKP
jgi:hypothetical protein